MRLRNWGGFWATLVFAILAIIDPAFAQNTSAPSVAPTAGTPASAPATAGATAPLAVPAVQSPVITNQAGPDRAAVPTQGAVPAQATGERSPVDTATVSAIAGLPADRNEFQEFVVRSIGFALPLFGYDLFRDAPSTFAPLDKIAVPADYVIGPGDEIYVRAWGQIDIDFRAIVDRDGRIHIPKVGSILVAGLPYQDLDGLIRRAVSHIFKNFEINVTLGQLRSIQIFVVGQARRPGTYTVSSLSTLVNALFASGGPSTKGTMRRIQLKRANRIVTEFDVYDLLVRGDKSKDAKLLPGDVIFIPPVGQLAAISGSVNVPAIYEIKDKSTLDELIRTAGGLTTTAFGQKVLVERIQNRETRTVDEFALDKAGLAKDLKDGDLVRVLSLSPRFDNAVTLQGNVASPARYPWRDGMRITDLLRDNNDLLTNAFYERQNRGQVSSRFVKREVNWEYATIQRLELKELTSRIYAFNLGKAIQGQSGENAELKPGDIVTIYGVDEAQPKTENDVILRGSILGAQKRFVWRDGMRVSDLLNQNYSIIIETFWERQSAAGPYKKRDINWDFATIQRLHLPELTAAFYPFGLAKAIAGDAKENLALKPGDIVTVYSAVEPLPKTEADVMLQGSLFGASARRFAWREGMKITDIIPDAQWLIEYYDYWSNLKGDGLRSEINWDFANVVRLNPADLTKTTVAFDLGRAVIEKDVAQNILLQPGDEVTVFTRSEISVPAEKQAKYVRVEGEVPNGGVYRTLPGETLRQLVARVGGVTANAYIYGAEFTRDSTRAQQQKKLEETLDRLEAEAARAATARSQSVVSKEDADSLAQQAEAQRALIAKLRQIKATGRIVLELPRARATLNHIPDLALEDGDRLFIPSRPSTVSVFGAVYNQNAFLYKDGKRIGDYLGQAGGPTKDADKGSLYLLKADGSVVSKQQSGRFFNSFGSQKVVPGDAIVVPEELIKVSWTKELKDWSQIFYQFALGVAGLKVLSDL